MTTQCATAFGTTYHAKRVRPLANGQWPRFRLRSRHTVLRDMTTAICGVRIDYRYDRVDPETSDTTVECGRCRRLR